MQLAGVHKIGHKKIQKNGWLSGFLCVKRFFSSNKRANFPPETAAGLRRFCKIAIRQSHCRLWTFRLSNGDFTVPAEALRAAKLRFDAVFVKQENCFVMVSKA